MAAKIDNFMPLSADTPSNNQRLFLRYFTAILIDIVVLNLFVEYSGKVFIDSFTISLLAALLLQILLKLTIAVEHWVANFFNARPGTFMRFMRFFSAWLVLFGSKFVILEVIRPHRSGPPFSMAYAPGGRTRWRSAPKLRRS
jgi:hypothetical protein